MGLEGVVPPEAEQQKNIVLFEDGGGYIPTKKAICEMKICDELYKTNQAVKTFGLGMVVVVDKDNKYIFHSLWGTNVAYTSGSGRTVKTGIIRLKEPTHKHLDNTIHVFDTWHKSERINPAHSCTSS